MLLERVVWRMKCDARCGGGSVSWGRRSGPAGWHCGWRRRAKCEKVENWTFDHRRDRPGIVPGESPLGRRAMRGRSRRKFAEQSKRSEPICWCSTLPAKTCFSSRIVREFVSPGPRSLSASLFADFRISVGA